MGDGQYGIDPKVTDHLAKQVMSCSLLVTRSALLSAATFSRGMGRRAAAAWSAPRLTGMGMLATAL